MRRIKTQIILLGILWALGNSANAGAYVFAGESIAVDVVTHPYNYSGTGGVLNVTIGIRHDSVFVDEMEIPVRNAIATWNQLSRRQNNVQLGSAATSVPVGFFDFESVFLHELGHSIGLAHVNAGSESGLPTLSVNSAIETTKASDGSGAGGNFETAELSLNAGADNIFGSNDDLRGNDINLYYFRIDNNDPFAILPQTIDSSTFSRNIAQLPAGHNFAANGDRAVAGLLGYTQTSTIKNEAVMQQGTFIKEQQRALSAGDIASIRYAQSGINETQGDADDYTINLIYAGKTSIADIVVRFDNTKTGFATSALSGSETSNNHFKLISHNVNPANGIFFNTGINWFFNTVLQEPLTPDIFEADDLSVQATPIVSRRTQSHSIVPIGDNDWVSFNVGVNEDLVIETSGAYGNTIIDLYQSDGTTLIQSDNDSGNQLFSRIERSQALANQLPAGNYLLRIAEFEIGNQIGNYILNIAIGPQQTASTNWSLYD